MYICTINSSFFLRKKPNFSYGFWTVFLWSLILDLEFQTTFSRLLKHCTKDQINSFIHLYRVIIFCHLSFNWRAWNVEKILTPKHFTQSKWKFVKMYHWPIFLIALQIWSRLNNLEETPQIKRQLKPNRENWTLYTGCTQLFLFFLTHLVQAISRRRAHSILFIFSGMMPRHLKFTPLYRFYLTLAER